MKLKILQIREPQGDAVSSPDGVAKMMSAEAKADRECFWILHPNPANRIIEKELVSMGTLSSSLIHPREVFKKVIVNGAAGIITVHNHPGDQPQPSRDDYAIWERLDEAGKILGIVITDHLIITPSGKYYSRKSDMVGKNEKEERHGKEREVLRSENERRKTYPSGLRLRDRE